MSDTSSTYLAFPLSTDATELQNNAFDQLRAAFPAWNPSESHLEVQLIEVLAQMVSIAATVAASVPQGIFRFSGKSLNQIPSIDAASATVPSTWTLTDSAGHTISAGTLVGYKKDGDTLIPFRVREDVVVSPGSNTTSAGEVTLEAVNAGTDANGLAAGTIYPIDALAWIGSIATTATTAGGVDAETDSEYLDRLRSELQLSSPRPILPKDFAVLARRVAGVGRSTAIDGYDAVAHTNNNERTITVAVAAEDGTALDSDTKTEVQSYLDSLREINFVVYVIDPTYTTVNITASVKMFTGADAGAVGAACEAALVNYLSPANWDWSQTVYKNELIALLSNVAGVDRVISITVPASDLALSGVAALPHLNSVSISVS